MKLGDPKGKKAISKAFRELEKLGFKVWSFSSNKRLNAGMKDFVDYVVLGNGKVFFIELKIGKDVYSEGQLETRAKILRIPEYAYYYGADENNYRLIIDTIVSIG